MAHPLLAGEGFHSCAVRDNKSEWKRGGIARSAQDFVWEETMKRREFLKAAGLTGVAAAATGVAMPAIAQSMPELKWRCTSSFPKSLDTIYGAAEVFAKTVA